MAAVRLRPAHGTVAESDFRPAPWLRGPHAQTVWASAIRRPPRPRLRWERVMLPDGDFLDLAWAADAPAGGPVVLLLHGLEGCVHSAYASGLMCALAACGLRPVTMHFRGCSGEPNRLPRGYHSGDTGDLAAVLAYLAARGAAPAAAIGVSLGGNVLLKYLGERGADAPLRAAAAVSVPFLLDACAERLTRGLSRLYQWRLLASLRARVRARAAVLGGHVDLGALDSLTTFRAFDDAVTAPLHGFDSAEDYYRRSSCRQFLGAIAVPTLIVHALDDPFMTPEVVPEAGELAPAVRLEWSPHGGHAAFVTGRVPWRAGYWLEQRLPRWLREAGC